MPEAHVEIVRRFFDRWSEGDFLAGAGLLDPNVVFVVPESFPEAAVVVGPEAIAGYMREFLRQWERYSIEAGRIDAVGDTVLVEIHQRATGTTSGAEMEMDSWMLFTFRGPRIIRIESVMNEEEAREKVRGPGA